MKRCSIILSLLLAAAALQVLSAQDASLLRPFTTRDGKTYQAMVESKTDVQVSLRLADGKLVNLPLRSLSDPDQMFVRKWSKFKDDLLRSAEFSKITVRDLLELVGYQSFVFEIKGNHIYVEGTVSGKPMKLMVDTGAGTTVFHDEAAKKAGLDVGPYDQTIYGVAGKQEAAVVKVSSIKLGDAEVTNRKYVAADLYKYDPNGSAASRDCDGILGADFLREWDAVISYREGRMFLKAGVEKPASAADKPELRRWTSQDGRTFFGAVEDKTETSATFLLQNGQKTVVPIERFSEADQDALKKWSRLRDNLARSKDFRRMTVRELLELRGYLSFQYRIEGNHILVDGRMNDTSCRYLIDTGAHGGVIHSEFATGSGVEVGPFDQFVYGIGGKAPAASAKVKSLQIGDVILKDRALMAADLFKDQQVLAGQRNYDAIFGADFLRELDAVVNYKENRIFLRPDNADGGGKSAPGK